MEHAQEFNSADGGRSLSTDVLGEACHEWERPNPTLVSTSVTVRYRADDGYNAETTFRAKKAAGVAPEAGLLDALEELARLTALFGFEDKALEAFNGARQRVFDWRKTNSPND